MENYNKKELINELQRSKDLMYGKEIINEQLTAALRKTLMAVLKTTIDDIIKRGVQSTEQFTKKLKDSFDNIASTVRNAKGSKLTAAEETAIYQELQKAAQKNGKNAVAMSQKKTAQSATADLAKKGGQLVKTGGDDVSKKVVTNQKLSGGFYTNIKAAPGTKSLVTKGSNITDEAGNVIVKNGQVTDLTPAIVRSKSGVPKLAPGLSDDAVKINLKQFVGAFDEPTAKAATGAVKQGSSLVGKMTNSMKTALTKLGILKNVGGKLTISWKRVMLYALLFGVGYSVVANWFKDNGVTPVKDPSDPIKNEDPTIVDPTSSGSQGSGTSSGLNTVVSQSPSGQNRYTFDFAAVMSALNATGKCPTGYGTSGTDGTNQTSGTTDTSVITTEPDTTLSSDDYYEYMGS